MSFGESTMRVAILDDDRTALQVLEQSLLGSGPWMDTIEISTFNRGEALMKALQRESFDALVVDLQLPGVGGDDILAWVRTNLPANVVVIVVTSVVSESMSALMLSSGADDYLTKPFSGADLLARLQRLLSRGADILTNVTQQNLSNGQFELLGFEFNRAGGLITWQGELAQCSLREFDLAVYLFRNVGRPLRRDDVYEAVYHRRLMSASRSLDALVHRLRTKLKLNGERGLVLSSIYGFGFRLDADDGLTL